MLPSPIVADSRLTWSGVDILSMSSPAAMSAGAIVGLDAVFTLTRTAELWLLDVPLLTPGYDLPRRRAGSRV